MRLAKPPSPQPVLSALSTARLTKYAAEKSDLGEALELYAWNAHISAALMVPSHFAEVLTRNAVSEALTEVYGPEWPWANDFTQSLPNHPGTYRPRLDLIETRKKHDTTGKVIADLKFMFWVSMFTARHHKRIWAKRIHKLFPNATQLNANQLRTRIYEDLDHIRKLRNRLAHHEPIITRDLADDLTRMLELVELRSTETRAWLGDLEEATDGLLAKP